MNKLETAKLLTAASLVDNRAVTEEHVDQWHKILISAEYDECVTALEEHYRSSEQYLTPTRIMILVRKARNDRAERKAREARVEQTFDPDLHKGKPANMDAMIAFWKDVWERAPKGATGSPETIARRLNMEPPSPIWTDEVL